MKTPSSLRIVDNFNNMITNPNLSNTLFLILMQVQKDEAPSCTIQTTAKSNATGYRWLVQLTDFCFEIWYRPEKSITDAEDLSRSHFSLARQEEYPQKTSPTVVAAICDDIKHKQSHEKEKKKISCPLTRGQSKSPLLIYVLMHFKTVKSQTTTSLETSSWAKPSVKRMELPLHRSGWTPKAQICILWPACFAKEVLHDQYQKTAC